MDQTQIKNDLVNSILYEMYPIIGNDAADTLKNILYMKLTNYEIQEKTTEVAVYKGDETENLVKKFLIGKKVKGCTDRTIDHYGKTCRTVFEKIGKSPIEVTADDIRVYIARRQMIDKVSNVTINNELRSISSFYSYMYTEEVIPKNPMSKIDQLKVVKQQKKAFTEIEVEMLRDQCRSNRERAIIEILLSTGCRVSELVNIKLSEIDGDTILVHGKGQKDRNVYLNAKSQLAIQKYLEERRDTSPYLFPSSIVRACDKNETSRKMKSARVDWYKNPEIVSIDNHVDKGVVESIIRKRGRKVGIHAHPHKFRRTCATFALRSGMPIEQVSKMLGHEDIGTTQRYLDLKESELKSAHERYVR